MHTCIKAQGVCRWQNRATDDAEVRAQAHCWHNPSGSDWGQPVKLELRPLPGPALPRPGQLLLDAQWGHARRLTGALPVSVKWEVLGAACVSWKKKDEAAELCAAGWRAANGEPQPQRPLGQAALRGQRAHPVRCRLCTCHGPEAALCIVYGHTPVQGKHQAAVGCGAATPGELGTVRRWGQGMCRGQRGLCPVLYFFRKRQTVLERVTEC